MPDQNDTPTNADLFAIYNRRGFVLGAEAPHALRYAGLLIDRPAKPPALLAGAEVSPGDPQPKPIYLARREVEVRRFGLTIAVFVDADNPPRVADVVATWWGLVERERKAETSKQLGDLLAAIHGDGGHRVHAVGIEAAIREAHVLVAEWAAVNEAGQDRRLAQRIDELERQVGDLLKVRAEHERLRKALVEAVHEGRNALVPVEHHLRKVWDAVGDQFAAERERIREGLARLHNLIDNLARKNEGQDHE